MVLVRTDATAISAEELRRRFRRAVLEGLRSDPKRIPCQYLYDRRGSQLFERICALPEYYPTRTEQAILEDNAEDIADFCGPGCLLIEPGSGSGAKTRTLLHALRDPAGYVAIDIAPDMLEASAAALRREFPRLDIRTVWADFGEVMDLGNLSEGGACACIFFPGSTIGNFDPDQAVDLLARFGGWARRPKLLLGLDLEKDEQIVKPAYNDTSGLTAEFNLNLLRRINAELGADFDLSRFRHAAPYRREPCRVEMHLVSLDDQTVTIGEERFHFRLGETIHSESSHKFKLVDFTRLAAAAGWKLERAWTDERAWFAVLGLSWQGGGARRL
jgi:L-histidine Nalpha-methyltransferase